MKKEKWNAIHASGTTLPTEYIQHYNEDGMPAHKTYFTPTTTATNPDDNLSTVLSSLPLAGTGTPVQPCENTTSTATDDSDDDDEASSNGCQDFASLSKYTHAHRHKHTQTQVVASLRTIAALTGNSIATIKEDGDLILDDETTDIPSGEKKTASKAVNSKGKQITDSRFTHTYLFTKLSSILCPPSEKPLKSSHIRMIRAVIGTSPQLTTYDQLHTSLKDQICGTDYQ